MKYFITTILIAMLAVPVGRAFLGEQASASVADVSPENQEKIRQIDVQLEELRQKLQILDDALAEAGFPKVLNNLNLPKAERNRIIDMLNAAAQLHNRIAILMMKKIDLQYPLSDN